MSIYVNDDGAERDFQEDAGTIPANQTASSISTLAPEQGACCNRSHKPNATTEAALRESAGWRHDLSMAIREFADGAEKIAQALNAGGEKAAYIRANARQFGEPLPLQLVCSVWMVMEGLEAAE